MAKAKLVKKEEFIKQQEMRRQARKKPRVVKQTIEKVSEWLERSPTERKDPRKAFEALFAQPQVQ
ncbi:MAG: hypothetical protein IPM66_02770 [Acidobacteriota bacterium]|nr:MAG: hypothetical protein IPM66_02770 [Acidobacteriota bacterium]